MKFLILFAISSVFLNPIQAQQNGQAQQSTTQTQQPGGQVQQPPRQQAAPESTEWYYPVPAKVQPGVGTASIRCNRLI